MKISNNMLKLYIGFYGSFILALLVESTILKTILFIQGGCFVVRFLREGMKKNKVRFKDKFKNNN